MGVAPESLVIHGPIVGVFMIFAMLKGDIRGKRDILKEDTAALILNRPGSHVVTNSPRANLTYLRNQPLQYIMSSVQDEQLEKRKIYQRYTLSIRVDIYAW